MLTDLESLRQYLGLDDEDTQNDDLLFEIIKRVSKTVNTKLSRTLEATDYTEYYKGDGSNKLLVNQYPVNSVASIYDDVDRLWPASTLKPASSIVISTQVKGLIQLVGDIFIDACLWPLYDVDNIKITYNAGYTTIPEDIESAVNRLCSVEFFKSKGMMSGVTSDRDPKSLADDAWDILNIYGKIR